MKDSLKQNPAISVG